MRFLYELLDIKLNRREAVCFVGAGGKTSSMFNLAQELKDMGSKVLVTTTTAIYYPQPEQYDRLIIHRKEPEALELIGDKGITVLGRARSEEGKLLGISPDLVDRLFREGAFDCILVEGDGSKGRPVKAPAEHEPVIPGCTTMVAGVIGLDCLGKPVDEEHVHRPEIFRSLPGCNKDIIDLQMLISLINNEYGLFKGVPAASRKYLILNKSDLTNACESAEQLADMLAEAGTDISGTILASTKLHEYIKLRGKRCGN